MAERIKSIINRITEKWKSLTPKQKTVIISSISVVIVTIAIMAFVLTRPNYEVLTTCKDYTELNEVTKILTDNNVEYNIQDNTLIVKVEKSRIVDAKMLIASADIKSDGYSFDDAMQSSFTTTEADKTKKYAHYLEDKFEKDLESMDGIRQATVTVNMADDSNSFYATKAENSVAVNLETSKTLADDTAESIAVFLATAVGNSTTNNITIIDSKGNTLFSGPSNASSNSGVSYSGKMKYKGQIEATTTNSLKQGILATGLYDDAYITLNYDLDWDAINTIATEYSTQGDEQAIFKKSREEVSKGNSGSGGTPGTSSNDDDVTYDINTGGNSQSSYEVKEYEYCPNSIVTTTVKEPGQIIKENSTLAVTLIKNVIYKEEECEKLGYLDDVTWDEFKAQNAASKNTQVDQVIIDNIALGTGILAQNISVVAYEKPWFEDKPESNMVKNITFWLQIVFAIVILGLLALIVIKSAKPLTVEEKEPELSVEEMLATTRENQPSVDDIDLQDKSETRRAIEKFVDENPEAVALLLRNWLNDDWG